MMPDLFAWLLTGRHAGERTNASTTQLLDPALGFGSDELVKSSSLRMSIWKLIEPGSEVGPVSVISQRRRLASAAV